VIGGIEMKWKFIGSTIDDSFIIDGVDIFKEKWNDTGINVKLKDPLYGLHLLQGNFLTMFGVSTLRRIAQLKRNHQFPY